MDSVHRLLVEDDLFILPSYVLRQPADNSCLYHALASGLHLSFPHRSFDASTLRLNINNYIVTNPYSVICLGSSVTITISDAITTLGDSSIDRYIVNQSNERSWGGIIEIAICATMYKVNIFVFRPISSTDILQATGTFVSSCDEIVSCNIYLLYSGFNHYDSIFDFVYVDAPIGLLDSGLTSTSVTLFQSKSLSYKSIIQTRQCTKFRRIPPTVKKVYKKKAFLNCTKSCTFSYRNRALRATSSFLKRYSNTGVSLSNCCVDKRRRSLFATNRFFREFPFIISDIEFTDSNEFLTVNDLSNRKSRVAADAKAYSDSYNLHSKFVVCAICGIEGSRSGSFSLTDVEHLIAVSGISSKFASVSKSVSTDSPYDVIFKLELNRHFENGLIRGINTICQTCYNDLTRIQVKARKVDKVKSVSDDLSSDDESLGSDFKFSLLPKLCLFRGLFCGSIPDELVGLTLVEESMINIYSAITNVSMAGGKHWQLRGGSCYTIINDLTSVAQQLPRMPTPDCIAILRHESTKLSKDYTYRPNRVYRALHWLKLHNHLYEHVTLVFPCDTVDWENNVANVDIPFVEMTDEEIVEVDEGMGLGCVPSDFVSSNPGLFFFHGTYFHVFFHFLTQYIFFFCFILASLGYDSEVLLEAPATLVTMLEDLRHALVRPSKKPIIRSTNHEFVCQYKNPEYYFSRCFATLYPYGRGCPSDENCLKISIANYVKYVLCLGGGPGARRFQQNSKFIFTA